MKKQDDVSNPAPGRFCNAKGWQERYAKQYGDKSDNSKKGMEQIHRCRRMEWTECIQGQDVDDLAYSQKDYLRNSRWLDSTNCDALEEGRSHGHEGKCGCVVRICVVKRSVQQHGR